ncbi:uncharacterized protein LMH87_008681 [Akanthomyces muscarius]|uniref:Zn(2)-C6 fungal-type domain-containing protein n=1 Tax=Akanthomyces muscarius TaxID=2231603 RepID=A0A9W8QHC7_AKAMU|nr:uncharacterized protein LMH87_008681 [Akanthomyces muscarius]KAJ4158142.1 hypothetical protein LMH87_008681 [Akanthomyces muscarius]
MPPTREVKTCERCRGFKRRCDLVKPSCTRCAQAGVRCSFDIHKTANLNALYHASGPDSTLRDVAADHMPRAAADPSSANGSTDPSQSSTVDEKGFDKLHLGVTDDEETTQRIPGSIEAVGGRVIRKRKRNCLSCLRCHRLKVKCDKELPCGRCKSSGNGRECYYSYNKGRNEGKFPCPTAPTGTNEDESTLLAPWQVQHKVRGSSHWRDLMAKIMSLGGKDTQPLVKALQSIATNACLANFTLPGNFPFGTPGTAKYYPRDAVVRLVESERHNIQGFVDMYFTMFDCVNPIVDESIFSAELDLYWKEPYTTNVCWMAQFLMVIGLGRFGMDEENPALAIEFMTAAEACLMQTTFMFRPNLLTLKTLCLAFVAKQVCNATCWASDSAWSSMGLLIRTAHIYGLPEDRIDVDDGATKAEKEARRKLWLTILYLDVKGAIATGMTPLTKADELGSYFAQMPEWGSSNPLQSVLHQALPTVFTVVGHLNSKKEHISFPDVLRYNARLRELMGYAARVCQNPIQKMTMDIFLRRCLMVLQRPYALHADGPSLFAESYWSSLECALALLMHYRDLWCNDMGLRLHLVGRAFVLDFFSATLTTYVHLLRPDAPLTSASTTSGAAIPPRQIILDTLRSCVEIWESERESSVCYKTGYDLLQGILDLLPTSMDC